MYNKTMKGMKDSNSKKKALKKKMGKKYGTKKKDPYQKAKSYGG